MSPERENALLNSLGKSGARQVSGERASDSINEAPKWNWCSGFCGREAMGLSNSWLLASHGQRGVSWRLQRTTSAAADGSSSGRSVVRLGLS